MTMGGGGRGSVPARVRLLRVLDDLGRQDEDKDKDEGTGTGGDLDAPAPMVDRGTSQEGRDSALASRGNMLADDLEPGTVLSDEIATRLVGEGAQGAARWLLPPGGEARAVVRFESPEEGSFHEQLHLEVLGQPKTGPGGASSLWVQAETSLPRISSDPRNVFMRHSRALPPPGRPPLRMKYVQTLGEYCFGPVSAALGACTEDGRWTSEAAARAVDAAPHRFETMRVTNNGAFPARVTASLLGDSDGFGADKSVAVTPGLAGAATLARTAPPVDVPAEDELPEGCDGVFVSRGPDGSREGVRVVVSTSADREEHKIKALLPAPVAAADAGTDDARAAAGGADDAAVDVGSHEAVRPSCFVLDTRDIDGRTLQPGETAEIRVGFFPLGARVYSNAVCLSVEGNPEPVVFPVSGEGHRPSLRMAGNWKERS